MSARRPLPAVAAALCVAGLVLLAASSSASTVDPGADTSAGIVSLYVSPSGVGSSCTIDEPCGTLTKAMAVSSSGAHVLLESGAYPRQDLGYHPNVAHFLDPVIIEPAPGATVTSDGLFIDTSNVTVRHVDILGGGVKISGSNIRFGWALIDGQGLDGGASGSDGAGVSVSGMSSNITIHDTTIRDLVDRDGIDVGDGADPQTNLRFVNNRIINAVEGAHLHHTDCFQLYGGQTNVFIAHNVFAGCTVSEVHLQASTAPIQGVALRRNAFIDCPTPGENHCDYYSVYVESTAHSTISGVRMTHNTVTGDIQIQTHPTTFADNILTGNFGDDTCGGAWEHHNLIGVAPTTASCPQGLLGNNDAVGLPTFVDAQNLNFALTPTSLGQGLGR